MVRIKERYILVNVLHPPQLSDSKQSLAVPDFVSLHRPITENLHPRLLLKAIRDEVAALFGNYGSGAVDVGLSVKYLSCATATFILKVSRKHYRLVWAALTMMNSIPGSKSRCIFQVVHVSGTIRKAEEETIRRARRLILAARDGAAGDSSAGVLQSHFGESEITNVDSTSDGEDQ